MKPSALVNYLVEVKGHPHSKITDPVTNQFTDPVLRNWVRNSYEPGYEPRNWVSN